MNWKEKPVGHFENIKCNNGSWSSDIIITDKKLRKFLTKKMRKRAKKEIKKWRKACDKTAADILVNNWPYDSYRGYEEKSIN